MTVKDLNCAKRKWKGTERITLAVDLILLLVFMVLTLVKQLTDFNSIAYFVLAVIFCAFMVVDLVILFLSWFKLHRINSLIAEQNSYVTDKNGDNQE